MLRMETFENEEEENAAIKERCNVIFDVGF